MEKVTDIYIAHTSHLYQPSQEFSLFPVRVDVELSDGTEDIPHVVWQLVLEVGVADGVPPGGSLGGGEAVHDKTEGRHVEVGGVTGPQHKFINTGSRDTIFSSETFKKTLHLQV